MTDQILAVIFDQGGVLSRGGGRGTNEQAASHAMGLDFTIEVPDLLEALQWGEITNAQFVEGINQRYNPSTPLTDAMWDYVYASLRPEPLSYEFASRCRESGRYVGLLSNINPGIAERLHGDGAYEGFYPLVLSCYAGCAKPDEKIYAIVEENLPDVEPGQILLLDDQMKCINGAFNRGWQALLVTSPEQMVREAGALLHLY